MPHLIQPTADENLRPSFLGAMREFQAETGHPDAGGLTMTDLEGATCLTHYTAGLRDGTAMRPGSRPLHCCEWWWVEHGPGGSASYIGRVALTHDPAPGQGHLKVSVRPSRRNQGHGTAILSMAIPMAHGYGIDPVRLTAGRDDIPARKMIENCGGELEDHHDMGYHSYAIRTAKVTGRSTDG